MADILVCTVDRGLWLSLKCLWTLVFGSWRSNPVVQYGWQDCIGTFETCHCQILLTSRKSVVNLSKMFFLGEWVSQCVTGFSNPFKAMDMQLVSYSNKYLRSTNDRSINLGLHLVVILYNLWLSVLSNTPMPLNLCACWVV